MILSLSKDQEEDVDNTHSPIIMLSYRNFYYYTFAILNPPNIDNKSKIMKDNLLTTFHFGIIFFLCHSICIDFYGPNQFAEMELLDQFINMKKDYPGLSIKHC